MKKTEVGRVILLVFSLIILIYISCIFYWKDIARAGLYVSDEGYYIQIVRTYFYTIKYLKGIILGTKNLGPLKEYLMIYGGPFFHGARQGYILLISIISSLFVQDYYFYHGLQWSAFFGIGCIFLTYIFVYRNFNATAALLSALLLSLSSLHIAFARSVLTITTSIFFLLLGITFYFESFRKIRFLKFSALSFAIAFSCHYNILWVFPIIFLLEIYDFLKDKNKFFLRIKVITVFSALPLIIIELITLLSRVALQRQPYFQKISEAGGQGYLDFFSDLFIQITRIKEYSEVADNSFFYYFNLIAQQHSMVFVLLTLLGFAIIINQFIKTKDRRWLFLTLLFFPFLFYSIIERKADRMVLPFIPFFCIYIGLLPYVLRNKIKYLMLIPLVPLTFYQLDMSKRALKYQFDIQEALTYMSQRQGIKHISSRMYISHAYAGRQSAIDDFFYLGEEPGESGKYTVSLKNLEDLYNKGFHYYLCYYGDNHQLAKIARNIDPESVYYRYYNVEGHYGRIPNSKSDYTREAFKIYDVKKIITYLTHLDNQN